MWQFFKILSGGAFFSYYAIKIFDDVGKNGAIANLILCFPSIIGSALTLCVIDKANRKMGMTLGILAQGFAFWGMCIMASVDNWDYLYGMCFIYILGAAYGQIAGYIWYAETIPGMGCFFSYTSNRVLSAIIVMLTPIMTDVWPGIYGTMVIYTVACFLGAFLYDWFTIETRGKTKDQIDQEYVAKKFAPFWRCVKRNKTLPVFAAVAAVIDT